MVVFYCSKGIRFSLGLWQKRQNSWKFTEKHENTGFCANHLKMSPRNLTIKSATFRTPKQWIFDNFRVFHRVLIGVSARNVSRPVRGVQMCLSGVKTVKNVISHRDWIGFFVKMSKNHRNSLFLRVFHGFVRKSRSIGIGKGFRVRNLRKVSKTTTFRRSENHYF